MGELRPPDTQAGRAAARCLVREFQPECCALFHGARIFDLESLHSHQLDSSESCQEPGMVGQLPLERRAARLANTEALAAQIADLVRK